MEEAYVKRALMARAADVVVLASAEKINAASPFVIAEATAVSTIVVDTDTTGNSLAAFVALGIGIVRA
jgi:DeoR/GlpR family transcriptional regulator of sugar metabolism